MKKQLLILIFTFCCLALQPYGSFAQWVKTNGPFGGDINDFAVSGEYIFVGTGGLFSECGIYRSADGGKSWEKSDSGIPPQGYWIQSLAISGSILYAGLSSYDGGGVFCSIDNGASWTKFDKLPAYEDGLGGDLYSIKSVDSKIAVSCISGVFLSSDYGKHWRKQELIQNGEYDLHWELVVMGKDIVVINEQRAFLLNDGKARSVTINLPCEIDAHNFINTELGLVDCTYKGIFSYSSFEKKWIKIAKNLPDQCVRSLFIRDGSVYAGTSTGIYRSSLDLESWTKVGLNNPDISCLAVSGAYIFAGSGDFGICRTSNNGESWTDVNNGISGVANPNFESISVTNKKITATSGSFENFQEVYYSLNNGDKWIKMKDVEGLCGKVIRVVLGKFTFKLDNNKVFRSQDNGKHWALVNTVQTENVEIKSLITKSGNLLIGTDNGVFLSTNNGDSWVDFNNGLPSFTSVNAIIVSGTELMVGTSQGVWKRPLLDMKSPAGTDL